MEAEVVLHCGASGRAAVPAGASRGGREARENRDCDPKRHSGRGTLNAAHVLSGEIAQALVGLNAENLSAIDRAVAELDGTPNFSRLGGNAALAASVACAKAAANANNIPLHAALPALFETHPPLPSHPPHPSGPSDPSPSCSSNPSPSLPPAPGNFRPNRMPVPMMNILNGGVHADNNLDIQEFMIVPAGFPTFPQALQAGAEIFHALRELLRDKNLSTAVGDEGGFAPDLPDHESALALLTDAVHRAGYAPGENVFLALDCAANELYRDGQYRLRAESFCGSAADFAAVVLEWAKKYPVASVEDIAAEDDFAGWKAAASVLKNAALLVGDDVFVTDADAVKNGADEQLATALLAKPNQAGSLSKTRDAIVAAREAGWKVVMSHRSGETEDDALADLAVGWSADLAKFGAPCRGERTAKYNRLLRICDEVGEAEFAGVGALKL